MTSQSEITYDVFISDPIPQAIATLLPNGDHQMWSPMSSTLIYGSTEAVLDLFPRRCPTIVSKRRDPERTRNMTKHRFGDNL